MRAYPFFLLASLITLGGCAPYQLAPVESVSDLTTLPHHEIDVVFAEQPVVDAPAPEPAVVAEPTFKDLPSSAWTVQIAALRDLEEMAAVESRNRLDDVIRVPTVDSELGELHTVLVGVYDNLKDAEQVVKQLPKKVAGDEPWIRSVASVQAVMR